LSKVRQFFFKQGLVEITSSKVCLKNFQQGLLEKPEQVTTETDHIVFRFRQIHLTFHHQGLLENFQSKSAQKFSSKVRLIRITISIAITIAFENFQARSGKHFSCRVWLKRPQSKIRCAPAS